jgi:orotidine-5'-phosphate decarboxylase
MSSYLERLAARTAKVGSCLCLGIDPQPTALPAGFSPDVHGVEDFANLLLNTAGPWAAAVKANLAFFEAFGSAGLAALERLRARVPAELPFIADAKRGDIGSTAERQAVALLDGLAADAVTANPYLGRDALAPFLGRPDRFVYVLCRTSNPSAVELQGLATGAAGEPLYLAVARQVAAWAAATPTLGLVIGATAPAELSAVRAAVPALPFLVPGVGAQGGAAEPVLREGPVRAPQPVPRGGGLLVNVSRGIASAALNAASSRAVEDALAEAAADWSARLRC